MQNYPKSKTKTVAAVAICVSHKMWKQSLILMMTTKEWTHFVSFSLLQELWEAFQRCSNAKMIAHSIIRSWKKVRHLTDALTSAAAAAAIMVTKLILLTVSIFDICMQLLQWKEEWKASLQQCNNNSCSNENSDKMTSLVSQEPGLATIPESPTSESHGSPRNRPGNVTT